MNAEQRQLLRINILRQAEAASNKGLTHDAYHIGAMAQGFTVSREQIESEVDYLTDKGLMTKTAVAISPEVKRFRILAQGRDWLAEQGF